MSAANRRRGVSTEQLAVKALRELGFPGAERAVRTGYRTAARELPDLGDIDGTPGLVWQVKSLRPPTAAEASVDTWMVETERQRVAAGASIGVLVVRREMHLPRRWWAFLPAVDLYGLADGFAGTLTPAALAAPDREHTPLMPVRLELRDACRLLRSYGFGAPIDDARSA